MIIQRSVPVGSYTFWKTKFGGDNAKDTAMKIFGSWAIFIILLIC